MSQSWNVDSRSTLPPVVLDTEQAASRRFCFMGEFGYEMISWLPYLLFLKRKLGIKLKTMGRTGSSVFYYFSDDHIELPNPPGDCWGEVELYTKIASAHPTEDLVYPGPEMVNRRTIAIGGYDWRNRDIHARIDRTNYILPDYSDIQPAQSPARPTVVINNKFFLQWPSLFKEPVNFFDRESLIQLRDVLLDRGFDLIYNHYVEQTANDKHGRLEDEDLFVGIEGVRDLRLDYARCRTAADRNRLQLATYNSADFVIGVQGGNLYLPAICRRDLFIQMRVGNYIDYRELGQVYGVNVETFYEPRHLVCWLACMLPARQMELAA